MAEKAAKKPPLKKPTQPATKKATTPPKAKEPQITEADFRQWLFSLKPKAFHDLQEEWIERNLKVSLKPQKDYDAYLNHFKNLPPSTVRALITTGQGVLTTEAFAALLRWSDILSNPHRIDKIHQSGLTKDEKKPGESIVELAKKNDRIGVLKATRDEIAEKLAKGAGARDTAALAREMTDIMSQIAAQEKRLKPGKETMLGQLTEGMPVLRKRDRKAGVRRNSFEAKVPRVTIKDVEGDNG